MKSPVTVAIVDDDAFVRSALVSYVSATPGFQLVHQCTNGAEAVEVIVAEPVDVVITDVRMPKLDGIGATAALRAALPDIKILVITSFDDDDAVREALQAGANGFLLKDVSPRGLVDAIRAVMEGNSVVSPGPITSLLLNQRVAKPDPPTDLGLSPRELHVLQLLCAAYSNTEIARECIERVAAAQGWNQSASRSPMGASEKVGLGVAIGAIVLAVGILAVIFL